MPEAEALFDLDAVGRAASRMDFAKLGHLNGVYMRAADDDRLVAEVLRRLHAKPPRRREAPWWCRRRCGCRC